MAGPTDIESPDFDAKAFVDDIQTRGAETDKQSLWEKAMTTAGQASKATGEGQMKASEDVLHWVKNLPKNVTVGTLDAIDSMADFADEGVKPEKAPKTESNRGRLSPHIVDSTGESFNDPITAMWRGGLNDLRSRLSADDTTSDKVTQGVAQFAVPFTGWMKAMRGASAAGKLGGIMQAAGAEAATVGTNFAPDSGRIADLLDAGRHIEGKLGDTLRELSPDGSALNHYINYMTDRGDETVADARWKNVVDSLGVSAGIGALLKAGPVALKTGRYALENAGNGPVGKSAQGGWIGYHGTPHKVDQFDINKIGTGQGAQTYGHGLYFAENKEVAGTYREQLTRGRAGPTSPLAAAQTAMAAHKDAAKAFKDLTARAANETDAVLRDKYTEAARLVKSGAADSRGELIHVEIPDHVVAKMIDYDKPLIDQWHLLDNLPKEDLEKMGQMLDDFNQPQLEELNGNQFQQLIGKAIGEDYLHFTPKDGNFDNPRKLAAEYLNSHGIPGVRYLDGGSRPGVGRTQVKFGVNKVGDNKWAVTREGQNSGPAHLAYFDTEDAARAEAARRQGSAGDGTRNLVLFDDKHVKIKGKE